ncbi:MAG: methyltransferase [Firmicutes bacterium]|nr:methyltransferase [Bacillota bacterium]
MEHYFTNEQKSAQQFKFDTQVGDFGFTFFSSKGVFSKDKLDEGSLFLIDTIIKQNLLCSAGSLAYTNNASGRSKASTAGNASGASNTSTAGNLLGGLGTKQKTHILDMGSGIGTLSIVLAKHFPHYVFTGYDVNQSAVALSNKNASANNISNAHFSFVDLSVAQPKQIFNTIITNPPIRAGNAVLNNFFEFAHKSLKGAGVCTTTSTNASGDVNNSNASGGANNSNSGSGANNSNAGGALSNTNTGGKFILVLRKKQGGQTYAKKLSSLFSSVNIVAKQKGYLIVVAQNPKT